MPAPAPVLIVGGGAAGLSAALGLASIGVASTVLESSTGRNPIDRGDVIHVSSQHILDRWGVWPSVLSHAPHRFTEFRVDDGTGRSMLSADVAQATGGGTFYTLRHELLVAALEQCAAENALIEVRRGQRVAELLRVGGRVVGAATTDVEHQAPLTIIAAGRTTSVLDGISSAWTHDYGVTFYNCHIEAELPSSNRGMYVLGHAGLLVVVPLGDRRFRVGVQLPRSSRLGAGSELDLLRSIYRPLEAADPRLLEVQRYPLHARWTYRWSGSGFAVVGDAAHAVHPVGGQGMNLAFADAEALVSRYRSAALDDPKEVNRWVRHYSTRRYRSVAPVAALTHSIGLVASRPEVIAAELRRSAVRLLGRIDAVANMLVRFAAT